MAGQRASIRSLKCSSQFVGGGKPLAALWALGKMIVYAEKFLGRDMPSPVTRDLLF